MSIYKMIIHHPIIHPYGQIIHLSLCIIIHQNIHHIICTSRAGGGAVFSHITWYVN